MRQFIIDGYNLVHKIAEIKNSNTPCHKLISFVYLKKLTGSVNNKVWFVFDGNPPPYQITAFQYQVVFSGQASADDWIVSKVEKIKNKKQILVVTDDRELGYKSKMLGAGVWRVNRFICTKKQEDKQENGKDIGYSLQREITEQMRKIWLDKKD